jgi:hypothetical protein
VVVGGGSVVVVVDTVVVGSPTVGVGGRELVGADARVVGTLVVVASSGGSVSSGCVGGAAGMNRRTVVVGAVVVSGGSAVVETTVDGPPSRLSGGREVVEVSDGSGRGAVTGAWLAASVCTSVCALSAWAATEKLVTNPTPQTALATPAMRRSKRAGWGRRRRRRADMTCFRPTTAPG